MWFFMYICYAMSILTFFALLTAFLQSFLGFSVLQAAPVTFMILTSILYCFTETLVIFFFVGTGVSIKEYVLLHKLDFHYHKRSVEIKRKLYPPLLWNILFMIILFVLVGAVDTARFPEWSYRMIFLGCIIHFLKIKMIENECFRENTNLILEMAGIKRCTI